MVRKLIRKIGYKIIRFFVPEIQILRRDISWDMITSGISRSTLSNRARFMPPYQFDEVSVGDFTYISRNSIVNKTDIGKFCSIGPNLFCGWGVHPTSGISTSPMFYSTQKQNGVTLSSSDKISERKQITIGNDVFIGANVTILDGITIGDGAVIGAGAVVSKDIPPYAIAVGCPLQIVKYRFETKQIESLQKINWCEFTDDKLQDVERMFFDVDIFIEKYTNT